MTEPTKTEVQTAVATLTKEEPQDMFSMFAVDKKRAVEGTPMKLGGTTFLIARIKTPKYLSARQALLVSAGERFGESQSEAREEFFDKEHRKLLAKHILVGWDVVKYRGELHTTYSEAVALELLQHDDFYDIVLYFADNMQNYLIVTEEDEKN